MRLEMKITKVSAYGIHGKCFIVIDTDEGISGLGECSPMHSETIGRFAAEVLAPMIVGQNPLDSDPLWHEMMLSTYKLGVQGIQPEAVAGIDIALWDIRGKATGQPIHTLLGGCYRDRIPMYKSIGGGASMTPNQMAAQVEQAVEEGYGAVKIRMDWGVARQDIEPEKDLAMTRECKRVCGDDVSLSFDANNGYSVPMAIRQGRVFEELGLRHFEEPIAQFDYPGMAKVAAALDIPISAGEQEYTRWQFRDLITQGDVDIIQPDVVKCAGITETMKIAALGDVFNRIFLPHQTQPTVGNAATLHICAALKWCDWPQEYAGPSPQLDSLFEEPLEFTDGSLIVPTSPGLGLTLRPDALDEATLFGTAEGT
jgi:L-alanine-DL-glutamate epimerase-like enolase superfamily enzyme